MQLETRLQHDRQTTLGPWFAWGFWLSALVGVAGLALGAVLGMARGDDQAWFWRAYLLNYCYFLSITIGALFFVAIQHSVRAGWSVTVRRLAEFLGANTVCLALLLVPILGVALSGRGSLYEWADPQAVHSDALLEHKSPYLDPQFFVLRSIVYLVVWWLLGGFFLRRSLQQDRTGDVNLTLQAERLGPVALVLLSVTVSFAAIDWLMSLEARWYSTIFGLYYFSGAMVAFLAAVILVAMALQAGGRLREAITVEHYHDLGKLLFGFVVFWAYIAFSQYLLIWYANIPEETTWYLARQTGSWTWTSLLLLFGHFLIPFMGLLSRETKRRKVLLGFWAVWLLVFHWIDLQWLVMPGLSPQGPPMGLIDVCCLLGIGGVYLAGAFWVAGQRPLVPLKDPRLDESLAFENV